MAEYNGWSNYETWCVSLWLSNDEGLYNVTREMASEAIDATESTSEEAERLLVVGLADLLKDFVEELPEVVAVTETASFVSDLLGSALSEVDWQEIAHNLLQEG